MRTQDVAGHRVQWEAVLFGKRYLFAIDIEGVYYMLKVKDDGTLEVL